MKPYYQKLITSVIASMLFCMVTAQNASNQVTNTVKPEVAKPEVEKPAHAPVTVTEVKIPVLDKADTEKPIEVNTKEQLEPDTKIAINQNSYQIEKPIEYIRKPLFALKTNLLFNLATLANFEIEVPIGNRWSIAAEWIFPWWVLDNGNIDSKRHRLEINNVYLEARYWFGNRTDRKLLTGWFAGAYTSWGEYDFEYNKKGVQGEFIIPLGLTAGYAHSISKQLSMEYSLGIGYMDNNYKHYNAIWSNVDNRYHPIVDYQKHQTYVGLTRAKVSLVWMLNSKTKK